MCTLQFPGEKPTPYQRSLSPGSSTADTCNRRALSTCAQRSTKGYLSEKGFWTQRQAGVKVPIQYPGMHLPYKAPRHPPPQIQGFSPRLPCDPCLLIFTWKDELAQNAGGDKDHRRRISKSSRLCPFKGAGSLSSER